MGGQIRGTDIRFGFNNLTGQVPSVETTDQNLADEIESDFQCRSIIERTIESLRHRNSAGIYAASVLPRVCLLIFQWEKRYLWLQRGHCQEPRTGSAPRSWNISTIRWQWRHIVG